MQNFILFDEPDTWHQFLPLTYTRPISEIRIGILKISEKWNNYLNASCSFMTKAYLAEKFPVVYGEENYLLNSTVLPHPDLIHEILNLQEGQALMKQQKIVALKANKNAAQLFSNHFSIEKFEQKECVAHVDSLNHLWDIFDKNKLAFQLDFKCLVENRTSEILPDGSFKIGDGKVFIEQGAKVFSSTFNTTDGDIYIGKDTEIMEGCTVRGPFALCSHSVLKMQTKIYGATTIGPYSKCGGELNNVVIFGFSNKAHDGFLGNAVIGEWCNIGADTNNSNLKNNYAPVKIWSYAQEKFVNTGLQFCGLFMADHAKCGINTMLNTGTVVGVGANVFGSGFPRNFIPSFSWGGAQGLQTFELDKAFEAAERVLERRNLRFNDIDKNILKEVFFQDEKYRK